MCSSLNINSTLIPVDPMHSLIELNSSRDRRKMVRRKPSMELYRRPYSAIIQRCRDFTILQFEKFCYINTIISLQPFPWQWCRGNKRTREWSLVFDFLLMKKYYFAINRSFTFNSINWARFIPFVLIFIEFKRKTYSILTCILFYE